MKVRFEYVTNMEEDGYSERGQIEKDGVEFLEDLLYFFKSASVVSGFNYVDSITATTNGGNQFHAKD